MGYTRDGKAGTARITTEADENGTPRVGVQIKQKQPHPFDVKIDLGEIGGPSAGLMFTLGIIDKLKPEDLTGGKIIAGTGTIDDEGNVGPIGGIPQKLVGAKDAGAQALPGADRQLRGGAPQRGTGPADGGGGHGGRRAHRAADLHHRRYAEAVLSLVTICADAVGGGTRHRNVKHRARRVCGAYVGHA